MMQYKNIMIDPPWPKKKGGKRAARPNQGRELDYKTMRVEDIFTLLDADIFTQAAEPHNVWMWTIEAFLLPCEREMGRRGYRRHARFIWDKTNGVAPAFTVRFSHEYLIWYYKPKMPLIDKAQRGKFMTVFSEKARQHSRKPNFAYQMVDVLYPDETKFDVFSREARPGWVQFGDQQDIFGDETAEDICEFAL